MQDEKKIEEALRERIEVEQMLARRLRDTVEVLFPSPPVEKWDVQARGRKAIRAHRAFWFDKIDDIRGMMQKRIIKNALIARQIAQISTENLKSIMILQNMLKERDNEEKVVVQTNIEERDML